MAEGVFLQISATPAVQLVIEDTETEIHVSTAIPTVELQVSQGVPGPKGEAGSAISYEFEFLSPLEEWTVNHNLGRIPQVRLLSVGGVEFIAAVQHMSNNQLKVYNIVPTAGKVVLV